MFYLSFDSIGSNKHSYNALPGFLEYNHLLLILLNEYLERGYV